VQEKEAAMRTISYKDPTGETAVGNILREERRLERLARRAAEKKASADTEERKGTFPKADRQTWREGA